MYFPYFAVYMVVGVVLGVMVFVWALERGQFKDQQRARFLPLENDKRPADLNVPKFRKIEAYGLVALACAGLAASAAVLIFSLVNSSRF